MNAQYAPPCWGARTTTAVGPNEWHPGSDAIDGVDDRHPKWSRSPGLLDGVFHRVCEKWASSINRCRSRPWPRFCPSRRRPRPPLRRGPDSPTRYVALCITRRFHRVRCSGGGPCLRLFTLRNSFMKDPSFTEYVRLVLQTVTVRGALSRYL